MTNLRHGTQYGTFFIVRVATTIDITLANLQTVDGVALIAGDLILVKNQTDQTTNGVYQVVDSGNWIRAKNFNTSPKLYPGLFLSVIEGNNNKTTYWKLVSPRPVVIGVDDILFDKFDGSTTGLAAGTQTATSGTVIFSNSNGLSFGMSNNSIVTGSYTVPSTAGLISAINVSAGTASNNLSAITFSNSNGISFGLDGSTITASVAPGIANINFSAGTTSNNLTALTFSNSNGLAFGLDGSTITGSYTVPNTAGLISGINVSGGTTSNNLSAITFSNSGNVSFGLDGSTLTATASFPAQTNQTVGLFGTGNTTQNSSTTLDARSLTFNGLGIITVGYSNGSVQLSATQSAQTAGLYALGNTTQNSSTTLDVRSLSFNGLGAATLGYSNGSIQVSVPVQTVQTQNLIQGIYDGVNSITTGTVRFSNSNGVTFGINGQTITASHNGITSQSNQTAGLYAIGNTVGESSNTTVDARSLTFSGAGVASVGYSEGNVIISVPAAGASINVSAGTTSNNVNAITFSNSNNVSFGLDGSTLTASASYSQSTAPSAIIAGTQTASSGSVVFSNSNNITFGMSGSSRITASYNFNLSAGTTSNNINAITFSNSNNISFGLDGSTLTASASYSQSTGPAAFGAGTETATSGTVIFSNSNGISFGMSNNSIITASYTTPSIDNLISAINFSAGTTSNNLTAITFSNSNGLAFGLDGSTITGSYTVPTQTNQTVGLYALGNTTQNSSTTLDARSLSFNGLGAASVGYSNGSIQVSVPVQTVQTQSLIQGIYDGTNSITTGTIRFSNSNGVSFGIDGQTITASHNGLTVQSNQTAGIYAVGNTVGESSSSTFDARSITFSGAGIASIGHSEGSIIISVPSGAGNINVSAGTTSNNLNAITFSNSNGVSFGLDGSTITASVAPGLANINFSAGTTSNDLTGITFSNSNNISFGLDGSTMTASASFAAQTNQTIGLYATGNTTQNSSTTLDARSLTFNGLGAATVGYSNGSVQVSVPTQTVQTQSLIQGIYDGVNSITTGTVRFSNSNGISFGINGQTITASHNAITSQTNQTVGLYAVGNTTQNSSTTGDARSISYNGLGAMTVGYSNGSVQLSAPGTSSLSATGAASISVNGSTISIGAAFNVSAGTTSNNLTAITFSNDNGVSFGLNGSVITASAAGGGGGSVNISAGTTSNNLTNFVFSNSNSVSFGLDGSTVTASIPAQTNQTLGLYALGNTTQNSSSTIDARSLSFNALGGATIGYSNNSVQVSIPNASLVTASGAVSISTDGNSVTIGAAFNVSAGTTSNNLAAITFSNSNGVSFGLNGSVLTASAAGGGGGGNINVSAGTTSNNLTAITFSNDNGVSFGLNGSVITASAAGGGGGNSLGMYAVGNTTQNSSTTIDSRSVSFNGIGAMTVGYSNGSVQLSAPGTSSLSATGGVSISVNGSTISIGGPAVSQVSGSGFVSISSDNNSVSIMGSMNVSAGSTSNYVTALTFSNSNGVSFGINGSVVTASAAGGGAGATLAGYAPYDEGVMVAGQHGQGILHIQPLQAPAFEHDRLIASVNYSNATNSSGSVTISMWAGIYTQNNSTLSLSQSISTSHALTFSGTVGNNSLQAGPRQLVIPWTSTWPQSNYWIGIVSRTTSGGANASFSQFLISDVNSNFSGILGQASSATRQRRLGLGVYTVSTSGIPNSIGFSQINGTASLVQRQPVIIFGSGTV